MQIDILELKNFYNSSLGAYVKTNVSHVLQRLEVDLTSTDVLFYGFGIPYLKKEDKIIGFMPAAQGIMSWPSDYNRNTLVYENALPLPDTSLETIVVIHGFEFCHFPEAFLQECRRVLKHEGRLILIVPNRRGIWAHRDHTPLGMGQPYTMSQLSRLLKKNSFDTRKKNRILYQLPFTSLWIRLINLLLKKIGSKCMSKFSGLVVIEAVKEVYRPSLVGKVQPVRKVRLVPAHASVVELNSAQ